MRKALCIWAVMLGGWMNVAAAAESGDYLFDALAKPQFAASYRQLTRSAKLPAWVASGGTSSPAVASKEGQVDARIYSACKPHDCPSEQIVIYYRPSDGHLSGVFVRNESSPAAVAATRTSLQWLGSSSTAERRALLGQIAAD